MNKSFFNAIQCLEYKTLKLAKSLDEALPITRISGGRYSFIFGTIFWSGTIYKIGRKTKFQYQSIRNQQSPVDAHRLKGNIMDCNRPSHISLSN